MKELVYKVQHFLGQVLLYAVSALVVVLSIVSVAGYFYGLGWQIELLSSHRPLYILIAAIAGIGFLVRKHRTMAVLSAMVILFNAIVIGPHFLPADHSGRTAGNFTLLHLNTNEGKADLEEIRSDGADIVLLQEVTPGLDADLDGLDNYTVLERNPEEGEGGSAILIKDDSDLSVVATESFNCR